MIRILASDLETKVDEAKPKWRKRAASFTTALKKRGSYTDKRIGDASAPSWSEVKSVFMAFQHNKCAYCERVLETAHELDVEHYRPKSQVTPWPGLPPSGAGRASGYHWLAYDLDNYCVACKPCNSGLKADHFPIAGAPGAADADVATLNAAERPLLIFPFGPHDADPETLIGWIGVTPLPLAQVGTLEHARAACTIAFFDLGGRDLLVLARATEMLLVWRHLDVETDPGRDAGARAAARTVVDDRLASVKPSMQGAVRAFVRLARQDREKILPLVAALDLLVASYL